ncbi:MAG: SDR family NAD(P)-dependent oxidoreductase, partial [Candidatus Obscuribacterales bacterium]|nr:SDR family NAD(P)-dependent oxidoreductase [Steroidobacteraceae bacterium]
MHDYRLSILGSSGAALISRLRAFLAGQDDADIVFGRYRPSHRRLQVMLSEHECIDSQLIANWLTQMPAARAAWDECQRLFRMHGTALLPTVDELSACTNLRAGDADFRAWHFSAQYALLMQLRTSVDTIELIDADGLGQLAALCAADALAVDTAILWLSADLSPDFPRHAEIPEPKYCLTCDCAAGRNPSLEAIDWRVRRVPLYERLGADKEQTDIDIVVIQLGDVQRLDPARELGAAELIACEGEYGLQRVFARLALRYQLDWNTLADDIGFVRLPAYRWQRDSFWLSRDVQSEHAPLVRSLASANDTEYSSTVGVDDMWHPLLGRRADAPIPSWSNRLSAADLPYLPDHRVQGLMVLPGSGYIELGLAVHHEMTAAEQGVLENVEFHKALVIEDDHAPLLRVAYDETTRTYSVYTQQRKTKQWDLHARGKLSMSPPAKPSVVDLESLQKRCTEAIDGATHYENMCGRGFGYGPYFQGVRQLWFNRDGDEVLAWVQGNQSLSKDERPSRLHPAIFDACLQTLLTPLGAKGDTELYIPVGIRQVKLHSIPSDGFWVHGILRQVARGSVEGEVTLFDSTGQVMAEARGVRAQVLTQKHSDDLKHIDQWLYEFHWENQCAEFTPPSNPGRWLVFSPDSVTDRAFVAELTGAGVDGVVEVLAGTEYEQRSATQFCIDAHSKTDVRRMLQSNREIAGIVYLWGVDTPNEAHALVGPASPIVPVVNLLQVLADEYGERAPSLAVVTRNAQSVAAEEQTQAVMQSPLIGLVRVAVNEYPGQRLRAIDIDADAATLAYLAQEVLSGSAEDEIALRGAQRLVHRMIRNSTLAALTSGDETSELGPQEVEVALRMVAVDRSTSNAVEEYACEGLGIITRTGTQTSQVKSGDEVYVCLSGAVEPRVTTPANCVVQISELNAPVIRNYAGQMSAFVTAFYALHHVARLQPGETLLIHEATSPLGLAAIQVARWLGALVHVTASGQQQRDYLQSLALAGVVDGSLDCIDRVVANLSGRGLDVVLNTMSGKYAHEYAAKAFAALAPCGRFIDVSNGCNTHAIAQGSAQSNRSISVVDIRRLLAERPQLFANLLDQVCERFRAEEFAGISPRVFDATDVTAAIAAVNADNRIGPIAIQFGGDIDSGVRPTRRFRQDGTYLITGGCGGFGLEVAAWMIEQGARDLALVGRRGAHTIQAQQAIEKLRARGARVLVIAADIAQESEVERVIAAIELEMTPLRGVFHAAAVLDDAPIAQIDPRQIENALAAKAIGAWYLHSHTLNKQLDYFVLFSSIAAMAGGAGQASYAMSCIY